MLYIVPPNVCIRATNASPVYAILRVLNHTFCWCWRQFWTNAGGGLAGKEDVHLADVCGISETAIRSSFIETTWEWSLRELEKNHLMNPKCSMHFPIKNRVRWPFLQQQNYFFDWLLIKFKSVPTHLCGTHQFVDVFGLLRREQKDQALTSQLLEWCSHHWSIAALSRINVGLPHRHPSLNHTKYRVFT